MWKKKYPQAFESEWLLLLEILDLIALEGAQAINITSDNSKKENDRNRAVRHQWNSDDELERYQTGKEKIFRGILHVCLSS